MKQEDEVVDLGVARHPSDEELSALARVDLLEGEVIRLRGALESARDTVFEVRRLLKYGTPGVLLKAAEYDMSSVLQEDPR